MSVRPSNFSPSRRSVLRGVAVLPVVAAAGAAVSACGPTTDEERDLAERLVEHARAAVRQQEAAAALAPRTTEYTAALTVVAQQRGEHAQALRDEVNRVHSSSAGRIDDPSAPLATVDALREALVSSTRASGGAAVTESGFVAGLLASVSASCKTLAEVQLA
ncbi:hypothetical protein L5G32_04780 [Gordonia sp. HY002]|uniref:hypothetical protein n=1 Tax=Gordonia zhenghanii TaxID=2911516 RepID=UPI001EF154DE|nr:hypothetical protein [Gordonia zhenghanii]MCF8569578.1 hypothetical protein [Gordonia zhenghanii]MCF8602901.1 hypothetical protein [Gordonia zhenghanii]